MYFHNIFRVSLLPLFLLFSKIFHWSFCLAASNYLFICFHADIRVTKHEQRPLLNAARSLKFRESERQRVVHAAALPSCLQQHSTVI